MKTYPNPNSGHVYDDGQQRKQLQILQCIFNIRFIWGQAP